MKAKSRSLLVAAVVCAAGAFWGYSIARADASSQASPGAFGSWNSEGEPTQLLEQARQQYAEATKAVNGVAKHVESGNLKGPLNAVGDAHVKVRELFRSANGLRQWREPAGVDFQFRADELHSKLKAAMQAIRDARIAEVQNLYSQLTAKAVAGSKRVLPSAGRLYEQQKYQECEATICKFYDDLEVLGVWFDTFVEREPVFGPLDKALTACGSKLEETRTANYKEVAAATLAKRQPKYAAVMQKLDEAAASLAATGQIEIGGQKVSGPQGLAKYVGGLQQVRLAALNCAALNALENSPDAIAASARSLAELAEFQKSVLPALAKIVSADAQRANEVEAATLYGEYIAAIAPLSALYDDTTVKNTFSSPLENLKAKSPTLAADAGAYQAATSDFLRWRARAAQAAARQLESKFPKLETSGLMSVDLSASAPKLLEPVIAKLSDTQVSSQNLRGAPTGDVASTGHVNYVDTRVPVASQAAVAFSALKADLLVTDPTPPLSLDAALALESTRRGDLVAAGGKVKDLELQAALPVYSRLGMSDWGIAVEQLHDNPFAVNGVESIKQIRLRVGLEPQWLHMRYAFVELPAK